MLHTNTVLQTELPAYIDSGFESVDNLNETVEYKFDDCIIAVERYFGADELTGLLEQILLDRMKEEAMQ
ncbi:MAG: hypothetical protein IJM20_07355 [Clostridia bacterium]|nr:hypothetical protein [Clostridia bacterium]